MSAQGAAEETRTAPIGSSLPDQQHHNSTADSCLLSCNTAAQHHQCPNRTQKSHSHTTGIRKSRTAELHLQLSTCAYESLLPTAANEHACSGAKWCTFTAPFADSSADQQHQQQRSGQLPAQLHQSSTSPSAPAVNSQGCVGWKAQSSTPEEFTTCTAQHHNKPQSAENTPSPAHLAN
jgi:hypothetical protein